MNTLKSGARGRIATINPATGDVVREFEPHNGRKIAARLKRAVTAFDQQRRTTFDERARLMIRAAEILESEEREWGRIMTLEMGKPIGAKVRPGLPVLCGKCGAFFGGRSGLRSRHPQLCALPTAGTGPGSDAVEFSVLASVSFRRPGVDGR